jgi:phospholipase C
MGGFVKSYARVGPRDPSLVMGHYKKDAVPCFDFFARNFLICDRWFSCLPTGTQANRLMAMAGESLISDNVPNTLPDQKLVYDWLDDQKVDWCAYQWKSFPFFFLMERWRMDMFVSLSNPRGSGRFRHYEAFDEQWRNSAPMPSVIFIEPKYTNDPLPFDPNDDHSPTGVAKGQEFVRQIYATLTGNRKRWKNTMMIITYDEHGGFFDHVPPLLVPNRSGGHDFQWTGPRVPGFIVSPHVPSGKVFSEPLDHTAILQLLAEKFTTTGEF